MRQLAAVALTLVLGAATAGAGPVGEVARKQALEHYRAGHGLMLAESWLEAEREFRAAIALDPLLVLAHYSLGQTYMALKSYPEAVKAFTGTIAAHKEMDALRLEDQVQADLRLEDELKELRDGIRQIQGSPKLAAMGFRDNMILKLEERVRSLESQKRRGAGSTDIPAEFSLALGSAHFRRGALPEASQHYQDAVKARPRFGEAHNNLAVVYMLTGRLEEAEKAMKAAEKAGFRVNPQFKADLEKRRKGA